MRELMKDELPTIHMRVEDDGHVLVDSGETPSPCEARAKLLVWYVNCDDYWAIISAPTEEEAIERYVEWVSEPEDGRSGVTARLASEKTKERDTLFEMTIADYEEWTERDMTGEPALLAFCGDLL